ncbi:hypothetical protein GSI_14176 [Ganoderma sinense ZZ0214-1]|uniref:Uncharacterized protein n=1 Tax=Ganoderma sinense ZZ0214-1 TaxID=1077348 RepID=A0A2G8RSD9_9APHY|nr:hypothetical protein GSI_14176 [Ganoderma sinense ZZ0214-1]
MGVLQSSFADDEDDEVQGYDDPTEPARQVRWILCELGLPTELVLEIMDLADYHPAVFVELETLVKLNANAYTPEDPCSSRLYLITPPIPGPREGENWRMRKVTWYLEGRDQGWGGEHPGTFNGAWSWYEACIFRPDRTTRSSPEAENAQNEDLTAFLHAHYLHRTTPDIVPVLEKLRVGWSLVPAEGGKVSWDIQSNKVAGKDYGRYTVEWRAGEPADADLAKGRGEGDGKGFIDALQPGDRVGLLMRAQFPGWQNTLRQASVELMYEVR